MQFLISQRVKVSNAYSRYPAYVTSAGWLGYDDEKVARLTKEAVTAGFNHFKVIRMTSLSKIQFAY